MPNPVVHFEIVGRDGPALQKFYSETFGWKVDAENPMNYEMVDNGGEGINGGVGQSPNGPHITWYVRVDDIDQALEKAESLGGKTVMPKEQIMDSVTLGLFKDPEGNLVGLVEGM